MAQDTAVNDPSDICCCGKSKSQTSRFMTGKKNIDYFTMQVHDESWCPKKCTRSNIHVINKWATTLLIKDNFQYTSLKKPAQIWAPIPKEYKNMPTLFSLQNKSTIYMQEVKPIPSTLNWPPYHPSNKYQHGNRIFSSWCAPDCQLNSTYPCPQVKGLNQYNLQQDQNHISQLLYCFNLLSSQVLFSPLFLKNNSNEGEELYSDTDIIRTERSGRSDGIFIPIHQ
jgi:hypothetical protein